MNFAGLWFCFLAVVVACPPDKTLSDCSITRVTLPLLPADDQYAEDKFGDAHPLFPRNDVLDVVVTACNSTFLQNRYTLCQMSVRSSLFNVSIPALLKPHGGDQINLSFRVKLLKRLFDKKGFVLKDTQDTDPGFLRERLSMLALRYSGDIKVQRESYARLRVMGGKAKTVIVEELVDQDFAVSRFGSSAGPLGVWKAGGNHEAAPFTAKNAFAESKEGKAVFASVVQRVSNATSSAPLRWPSWRAGLAYVALASDWDRNYYLVLANQLFDLVVYDVDRTWGSVSPRYIGNATDWPVQFCESLGGRNIFCTNVMDALGNQYPAQIATLIAKVLPDPLFAELAGLQQQASQLPGVNTTKQVEDIRQFVKSRLAFLQANL